MVHMEGSRVDVFDYIAEQIARLRDLNPKAWEDETTQDTIVKPPDLDESIAALFESNLSLYNTKELLRYGISCEAVSAISQWPYYDSYICMVEVLAKLSRNLPYRDIIKRSPKVKQRGGFEALNGNAEATGLQIVPRVPSIHDDLSPAEESEQPHSKAKHWASERSRGINQELANIMCIETRALQLQSYQFQVMHHIIERDFFPAGKKELLIGVSPLVKGDFLDVAYETRQDGADRRNFFHVKGLKNSGIVKAKMEATVLAACERKVDILIFPEILGSEEIVSQEFIDYVAQLAEEKGLPMPSVILWPTWWHNFRNELYVTDGSGDLICRQQKQYPFKYTDPVTAVSYAEDLQNIERVIHVIHIPQVGRLTLPICRDYLEPGYVHLMADSLESTFLLCPSYSKGKTQFDLTSPGEIKYGCFTVWINTCAARCNDVSCPEYVGLVSGPPAEGEYIRHLEPKCGGTCDEKLACLFLVHISMDHEANISCKHTYDEGVYPC